jgi:hypothetical protein
VPLHKGCPAPVDSDGDGVTDDVDQCINDPGTVENNGCPVPADSDGDGVTDDVDQCVDVTGNGADGCPIDSDGDGIRDGLDECINDPGPAENNGCPETAPEEIAPLPEETAESGAESTQEASP